MDEDRGEKCSYVPQENVQSVCGGKEGGLGMRDGRVC